MTSSNGNIFRVTGPLCGEFTGPGEFPAQRPVTRSFDVFFDLRLYKRLSKQPLGWWFETPAWSLWRHRNVSYSLNSRIRVRYGDVWAPRHPSSSGGTLHSFTIDPDETLETMECLSGWVIHMIRINTTKGSYVVPRRYRPQRRSIYLENGMFFTGAQARYGEMCLTKLSARTALCNP